MKIFLNITINIILILFICNISYTQNYSNLYSLKTDDKSWLPNTKLIEGLSVIEINNSIYFCVIGGLIEIEKDTKEIHIHRFKDIKSDYPYISGITKVKNKLWITFSHDDGIFVFDTKKNQL